EIVAETVLSNYFTKVVSSHSVRREIREYERFCTALIEGYCLPVVSNYMNNLNPLTPEFYIMQSNGGRSHIEHLWAVNMIKSGPAGGVAATQALSKTLGISNAIAYDMGGTSADVSAIVDGAPIYTDTIRITGLPIKTLAIDIESIGAGGGSVAWVDDGGALKVGPQSAGAHPGPACYYQGGKEFTVSDANLINGVLGKNISKIELHGDKALAAGKPLCQTLDMDIMQLSSGMLQIVNNNMVSALKKISIGKGYDPRTFALVAFGGAGPMHACAIAEAIGIKRVIIPSMAGAFSAVGILTAPVRFDYVRTILLPLESAMERVSMISKEFQGDLSEKLKVRDNSAISYVSLDLRYSGQGHEINIPISDNIAAAFQARHETLFGFTMVDNPIEVVNVKMVAEVPANELPPNKFSQSSPKVRDSRNVNSEKNVGVYNRDFHDSSIEG
ncbi:MAG: hydantoinase/oxoprolinase family protein, partial [Thermoplasmata archaeon]|nr:hydantoinase/oxoprolinase family protein [Thermoplasmata archaeon]